jgi:hypothetical protein
MLIIFIGLSFLCGVGLGGLLVLALVVLRKATPQRTKWVMLGSASLATLIAVVLILYGALSPKQEEQLQQEFQSIPNPGQSVQWYEYTYIDSSATGECASTSTHRWFGLSAGNDGRTLLDWYNDHLAGDGWQLEKTIWRKATSQGKFTLNIEVFTNTAMIDPQQWFYTITDNALKQALQYPAAYVLRLNLISPEASARCFRQ